MKIDLHIHSTFSGDSINSLKTIIKTAQRLGIGIAITDHNTNAAWKEIEALGKKEKVLVIKGEERKVFDGKECVGEILGLFLHSEIESSSYLNVIDEIHSQGGLAVLAHPFDSFRKKFKRLSEVAKKVDAVECYNSRTYMERFNSKAKEFAKQNSLPCVAGSDAHTPEEIGSALTEVKANTLEEIKKEIKNGRTKISGRLTGLKPHLFTFLAKNKLVKEK